MLYDEMPLPFVWYDSRSKQNRHSENVSNACGYKLISPNNAMLPFQIRNVVNSVSSWKLYCLTDNTVLDMTADIGLLQQIPTSEGNYIAYFGELIPSMHSQGGMQKGCFYYSEIMVGLNDQTFYSEVFHVPDDSFAVDFQSLESNYLRLSWWNSFDIRPILYNPNAFNPAVPFKNVVYLDTFITHSEPRIEIEGTKDGVGTVIPTWMKLAIEYNFEVVVPDYLKIALVAMRMHDNIQIITPKGVRNGLVSNMGVETAVEGDGAFSSVRISFEQDLAMTKGNCGDNIVL